ncbi:MAG: tRNA pseudouridine(55) synthase TruB [Gemmatimonadetes bacterium]|nr:tRNA pseudouridine(55) synthase TruB [Gemmatimonadota bacterium]
MLPGAKIGHAGTLDPDATGVLVICVGKATKISSFLMEGRKEYSGTGCLGVTTDSQDATGEVLEERPVDVAEDAVRAAVTDFVGEVEQIPPMYSAVKVDGQRLYRLARKGVEVEREPRRVNVYSFDVDGFELPRFRFVLECSKGTYVRTLLHDLGEQLGCGGHLAQLTRTRQGPFRLEEAVPWEDLLSPDGEKLVRDRWVGPDRALSFLPARPLPVTAVPCKTGDMLPATEGDPERGSLVRLTAPNGEVRGVGRVTDGGVRVLNLLPASGEFGRGRRAS